MNFATRLKPVHLRLVSRIAETGKLQRAAGDVLMSQPAASRMLSDIERLAGSPLFERHPKGMSPTPLGQAFHRYAQQILQGFDDLDAALRDVAAGRAGQVRIGSVTGPAAGCLVPAIRKVRDSAPNIEFTIEVGPSTRLLRGLSEDEFDFVIARLPPEYNSRDYRIFPARNEVVSLMVRHGHPLAGAGPLGLAELTGFEWVIQDRGSPIRGVVEQAFHTQDVPMPDQVINSSSLLVALAFLQDSDAIVPMSQEVVDLLIGGGLTPGVTQLELSGVIQVPPFFVICRQNKHLSPATERVIEEVLARF